jgi:predicted secreted protein
MAIGSGTALVLEIHTTSTTVILKGLKSNGINITQDFRETTSKDVAAQGYKTFVPTRKDVSLPFSGLVNLAADNVGIEDILGYIDQATAIFWELGSGTTGDVKITGGGFVADLNIEAPDGDNVGYSGSLKNSGAITLATY